MLGRRLEINTKKDSFKLDLDDVGENSISGIDPASREKRTVSLSDIVKAQVELKFR
ncbi:MAG: hypothetical protein L0I80_04760 [Brevibacterium sp.]|nr:hypothetical protein [Brevibacterium sp.]